MGGLKYEEVAADDLAVKLTISNVVKLNEATEEDVLAEYGYDKSALRRKIDLAKRYLEDELDYTIESVNELKTVVDYATTIYEGTFSDKVTASNAYEEQINLVQAAIDALVLDESAIGDKTELEALVAKAKAIKADEYTNSSYAALTEAIEAAEKVLAKDAVKQSRLDEQVKALQAAIDALEKKPETALDKDNLADGKYTITAEMIKTDRKSKSMSNNAINHTVQLEVVDGEYFVTMQFKGLAVYDQFGYLKDLGYYDAGYTYNDYGIPQGTVIPAEVLSYYDVVDQYNSKDDLYPEKLRFKLVDKASADFVPLQVFVPIMEAIAEGTGTQDVLMSIDWSSLAAATDETPSTPDDPAPAKQSIAKATVKVSNKTYTGKALKPAVTVTLGGKTLKKGTDYTVSYKNNKKVGKATVTVTGKGSYTGTKSKAFIIKPAKMKIKAAKSTAKNKIKVTWTKAKGGVTGYKVQIALNKKFTKSKKTYTVKKASAASKTITKLKSGKKYFVRVRAYKTVGKKTYYGKYSAIKTVKVK
ncbi:MAG: NEAT domain-containing protein [Ruminococcus sp.]|nr:NEAT domain-containing protein [Ruminococcus sp.]